MENRNEMDKIIESMMEHVCDKLCRWPWEITDQEEMSRICHECELEKYAEKIRKEYDRINDFQKTVCVVEQLEQLKELVEKRKEIGARPSFSNGGNYNDFVEYGTLRDLIVKEVYRLYEAGKLN